MNSNAKAVYGACILFLIWAGATGAEIAWRLFFMGATLLILLELLLLYWTRRLSCTVELRTQGAPYQGAFEIIYVFANNGLLPIPECRLTVHLEKELGAYAFPPEFLTFAVSEIKSLRKECRCPRRGIYSVGGATVTLTDPLGLKSRQVRFDRHVTVEVFPDLYPVETVVVSARNEGGALRGMWQADQDYTSISRLRSALPQESSRHIHWKASARTEELQVREYESRKRPGITVLLDSSSEKYADDPEGQIEERCVEVAAGLAVHWLDKGYEVELITGVGAVLRLKGSESRHQALRTLMVFQPEEPALLGSMIPRLQGRDRLGSVLQIVTPSLTVQEQAVLSDHPAGRTSVFLVGIDTGGTAVPLPIIRIPVEPVEA